MLNSISQFLMVTYLFQYYKVDPTYNKKFEFSWILVTMWKVATLHYFWWIQCNEIALPGSALCLSRQLAGGLSSRCSCQIKGVASHEQMYHTSDMQGLVWGEP